MNWSIFAEYVKSIWAVAGPLLGVLVGAYIANRNQRTHWISDNKKEEYRELLAAMSKTIAAYMNAKLSGNDIVAWHNANPQIRMSLAEVMESRIFIGSVVKRLDLDNRFFTALHAPSENKLGEFFTQCDLLCAELLEAAFKDLGI
jgi:hypothetical protein